ncbi:MurR/RpiR family transcriptional regulator [Paenirhodobacter populi]|uniref:MurR/RpiR family transcriptional regulator n=1 Tax=Paenirhodobacter populi TaxID=2306993 RepID=A0A443IKF0_9RHOB|nr:MurR/RpiR family transcriptional regulator [Sinirhodobacter populi]RWR04852.1 MurR/RpiR family transcriptional regulator [Sinirhodobacter populi]
MSKGRSFLARVRAAVPTLRPAERKLGELISDFPGELASYNASELAELAGVSNATVTRFVRRLGYQSYEEARLHAREEQSTGSRFYIAPAPSGEAQSVAAYTDRDSRNLQLTLAGVDLDEIDTLATKLMAARKVWVIGFRASAAFAAYLQWQMTQVIEEIVAIPGAGQTMGEHLVSLRPGDVVIFFAMRRQVSQTEAILREIAARGPDLVYVTDEGVPPLASVAWHFRCETASSGPLFNHVAVMGLCNLIANRTIALAERTGRDRLREIEQINDALNEL